MATPPKLIVLAGSARKASHNKRLARLAADIATREGAEVTFVDLADYPMPLYNGDLEEAEGVPENASKLKAMFREADGFFIATPEYNSSLPPLLKNTLDWISRKESSDEPPLAAYKGKAAALAAASPGALGGMRVLVVLRMMLANIGVYLVPEQLALSGADKAFGEDGRLTDAKKMQSLESLVRSLVRLAERLRAE